MEIKNEYIDQIEEGMRVIDEFETRWSWQRGMGTQLHVFPPDKLYIHAK